MAKSAALRYVATINTMGFSNEDFNKLRIGQWVSNMGVKGQFLGVTASGIVTINYNKSKVIGSKSQFCSNEWLRKFAKVQGATA